MGYDNQTGQVVYTNKAHCRDCYRCLRVCPVKAIRMEKGQAYVVAERCISCGTCIRECPQGAKSFRNDVERAAGLIASGDAVAASIAPSFVAIFNEWERKRLPSALRRLGFAHVGETAVGAYHVAGETARLVSRRPDRSHICTACPAIVSYIERYQPDKVEALTPIVSPMIAHAKHIRSRLSSTQEEGGATRVVFIGPCVAKKAEAERPENRGTVDCVLTFTELQEWFEREGINLSMCEESHFDEEPEGDSRYYPLVGGSIRTARLTTDLLADNVVSVSGFGEASEVLAGMDGGRPVVIEPLFCSQGCVNGPAMPSSRNVYQRRHEVLDYTAVNPGRESDSDEVCTGLSVRFSPSPVGSAEGISEEQIREVLEQTGKASPENQLNCGACGYASCREKAVAVIQGMAEAEMCIPHMKRLAEQRTDRIIETSPNGIVIVDEQLNIISMNPAFRRFFMCSEAVCGRPISYLMDPDPFERLATGSQERVEVTASHPNYNLVCHQIHYRLPEERQYVGIFVNITKTQSDEKKLDQLREQTLVQARELLEHQVNMAQMMAKFLGESTAQSEGLLEKLMLLVGDEAEKVDEPRRQKRQWAKDTYTSK